MLEFLHLDIESISKRFELLHLYYFWIHQVFGLTMSSKLILIELSCLYLQTQLSNELTEIKMNLLNTNISNLNLIKMNYLKKFLHHCYTQLFCPMFLTYYILLPIVKNHLSILDYIHYCFSTIFFVKIIKIIIY